MISPAGSTSAATRPAKLEEPRPDRSPDRLKTERPRAETWSPERADAAASHGLPPLQRSAGFIVQQLLAAAPELGASRPSRRATLAAYEAHLARRISYSGPLSPVDLRV